MTMIKASTVARDDRAQRDLAATSDSAFEWLTPERLADHIRSGCVYDEQPPEQRNVSLGA